MIIDARNVNLSLTPQHKENETGNFTSTDAKRLVAMLDEGVDAYTNIKNVPTAAATAAKTDTYTEGGEASGCIDVSQIKMVKLLRNYERDYTAYDALQNTWIASTEGNCFALYKSCSKVSDPAAADMSKGEFLDYVRQNGLDREISWEGVKKNLTGTISYDNFTDFTDYAASLFANLEERINADFSGLSGEERKIQLQNLNSAIDSAVSDFAEQIDNEIGKAYADSDYSADKLKDSIAKIINDKKSAYTSFIKKNKDYAGVENTEDSWLKRDLGFMNRALRNAYSEYAPEAASPAQSDLWSEKDIIAMGMASQLLGEEDDVIRQACAIMQNKDEEYVGMGIAMKWAAATKITVELGVSDSVKGLIGGLLEKYAKEQMDAVDMALAKNRQNPMETTAASFPKLDRTAVMRVVTAMQESYAKSGDLKKAIIDTAAFARNTYLEKAKNPFYADIWRYNCSSSIARSRYSKEYWENFYHSDKNGQSGGMSKILSTWDKFADTVEKKNLDYYRLNTGANTFRAYKSSVKTTIYGGYENGKPWRG